MFLSQMQYFQVAKGCCANGSLTFPSPYLSATHPAMMDLNPYPLSGNFLPTLWLTDALSRMERRKEISLACCVCNEKIIAFVRRVKKHTADENPAAKCLLKVKIWRKRILNSVMIDLSKLNEIKKKN